MLSEAGTLTRSRISFYWMIRSGATVSRSTGGMSERSRTLAAFTAVESASNIFFVRRGSGTISPTLRNPAPPAINLVHRPDEALQRRSRAGSIHWTQRIDVGRARHVRESKDQFNQKNDTQIRETP